MPQIDGTLIHHYHLSFITDFGWIRPVSDGQSLIRLDWNQAGWDDADRPDDVSRETHAQMRAYFSGKLRHFNLPLKPVGKSDTGQYWLAAMARIPYGTVMTYGEFAAHAGKPGAARAAGSACARNPIPIIYPCHRVIRGDGTLGNYSGGDEGPPGNPDNLARKARLITLEREKFRHQA
jgi:methylated-DNA-[protein]-cysteine S-methyltransferase